MPAEKQDVLVLAPCNTPLQLCTGRFASSHCTAIALSTPVPDEVLQPWDCSLWASVLYTAPVLSALSVNPKMEMNEMEMKKCHDRSLVNYIVCYSLSVSIF